VTDVYVVGIDMIRFGRYPDRTVAQLAADAALLALDDCGVGIHDVQALYSGNIGETMTGDRPAHPAIDRPYRHTRGELHQCLRHGGHSVP